MIQEDSVVARVITIIVVVLVLIGMGGAGITPVDATGHSDDADTDRQPETVYSVANNGSAPSQELNRTYGGERNDMANGIRQTSDGGFLIVGNTFSFDNGTAASFNDTDQDAWLIKVGPNGNEQWNQTYGGTGTDEGVMVRSTEDDGFLLAGQTLSFGDESGDAWLVKVAANGTESWNQTYGGNESDLAVSVEQGNDSKYTFVGTFGTGDRDIWLVGVNDTGTMVSNRTYGGSEDQAAFSFQRTDDDGFVVAGFTLPTGNLPDALLLKINPNGTKAWDVTMGDLIWQDHAFGVIQTQDDGYVLSGRTHSFKDFSGDAWLVKVMPNGTVAWNHSYGGFGFDTPERGAVLQTEGGDLVFAASTNSLTDGHTSDAWLIRVHEIPPNGKFENSPTDPDNDGLYEDVNGDGDFTLADVQALLTHRNDPAVQNNPDAFDFNGDGQVSLADVQALLNEYQSG